MSLNRAELLRRYAAHKAAAAACEAALKADAANHFAAHGTALSDRAPGVGTLSVSLSQDTVDVHDEDMLLDWLQTRYPTEVLTRREVTVSLSQIGADESMLLDWLKVHYPGEVATVVTRREVISPAWRAAVLARLTPLDPTEIGPGQSTQCMDSEGTVVGGVSWRKGGTYLHASILSDAGLKRQYALAAKAYVEQSEPMPAIGPPPLAVTAPSPEVTSTEAC